jgi:xanthine dehydrogenase accessory factor
MRDVIGELLAWWETGEVVAAGTAVATFRSAPQPPGATMLVGPDGSVVGSVSGGCVEGTVYELASETRVTGKAVVERFGVSDDDAFAVGLTCGGDIEILVSAIDERSFPRFGDFAADVLAGRPVALVTVAERRDSSRVGRRMLLRSGEASSVNGSLGKAIDWMPRFTTMVLDCCR